MRYLTVSILLIFITVSGSIQVNAQQNAFGINFDSPSPYTTQWVFKDAMKQSAEWVIREFEQDDILSDTWVSQDSIALPSLDSGYPTQIPFSHGGRQYGVSTVMLTNNPAPWHYPAGQYRFSFEGTGHIVLTNDVGFEEFTQSGVYSVTIDNPSEAGIVLSIISSDVNDPVRNIQFFMPGYGPEDESIFYPDWLEFLSHFDVIRPMKGLNVEWSTVTDWSQRTTSDFYTQYDERATGMALEYMIELHNEIDRDLYLNMFYLASNAMIDSMATMVLNRLDSELNVYLEYSNETWNSIYPVFEYAMEQGVEQNLSSNDFQAGQIFTVKRSIEIFEIFERVFGAESDRLIKVIPAWVEFPNIADTMLAHLNDPVVNPNNIQVDKLAIGMYFGGEIGMQIVENERQNEVTVDEILDSLRVDLEYVLGVTQQQKNVADKYNVDLITYESGQHLITSFWAPDEVVGELLNDANRSDEMYEIYMEFLAEWTQISGDLNVLFSSVKNYTEFGSFGMKEHFDQDDRDNPKMRAYLDYVDQLTTTTDENDSQIVEGFELHQNYPNPFNPTTQIAFSLPYAQNVTIEVFNVLGQKVAQLIDEPLNAGVHSATFNAHSLSSGVYLYRIRTEAFTSVKRMLLVK